jgi:glycosyltransferase involved in cell wall biosynthesis
MTRAPRIEVLLATYNGARFLRELLDSLLAQSDRDFTVLAGDDCSADETPAILADYARDHPGFLRVIAPTARRLGPSGNFARLLDAASADYIMFCDQDDVWLPDKIAASLARMQTMERAGEPSTPVLVHTDLAVVDASLRELGPSFSAYAGLDPERDAFAHLLLGNVATGCTMLANRALYRAARPIPPDTLMFDHWMAQVAAGIGRIGYLDRATILYRQHSGNAVGAMRRSSAFWKRVRRIVLSDVTLRVLVAYSLHAATLAARYPERLGPHRLRQAQVLATIWARPRCRRFPAMWRAGLRKASAVAEIGLFLLLPHGREPPR